jgi:hypothetical protein
MMVRNGCIALPVGFGSATTAMAQELAGSAVALRITADQDTLARATWGDGDQYLRLFDANLELPATHDKVAAGQVLRAPPN